MSNKLTTSEVIKQFKETHKDKYDYSLVEYVNTNTKVKIICKEHGEFEQSPTIHKGGSGCPTCRYINVSNKNLKSQEQVIYQFKETHKDRYDYSKVVYKGNKTKVTIICPKHGEFKQDSISHIKGSGCTKCAIENNTKNQTLTQKQVIEDFKKAHGDRYDYSLVEYKHNNTKVKIICKEHGVFLQSLVDHRRGCNCPKCMGQNLTNEDLIKDFKKVHGDRYDYSKVEYKSAREKVKIICKEHGIFEQTPNNHKNKHGCPKCKDLIIRKKHFNEPTILYYIKVNDLYKIGITKRSIKKRFEQERKVNIKIIKTWKYKTGKEAWLKEQEIIEKFKEFRYLGENILIDGGNSELFIKDILEIDKY